MAHDHNQYQDHVSLVKVTELDGHQDRVWSVAWSPTGSLLASCSGDKTIRLWAPPTTNNDDSNNNSKWSCVQLMAPGDHHHQRTIRRVEWSPSGRLLVAASFDSTVSIWARKDASAAVEYKCVATLEGHENEVKGVAWNAQGSLLATCSRDKTAWIWELTDGESEFECAEVLTGHTQDVKFVRWHPTEDILFTCSYDDTIKIWTEDDEEWSCSQTLSGHSSSVWELAFDGTGSRIASVSSDNVVIIWQSTGPKFTNWTRSCTLSGFHTRPIFTIDWSARNGLIATGASDDTIRIFREVPRAEGSDASDAPSTFELAYTQHRAHTADVNCVRWHPQQSDLLASCGDDQKVIVWRIETAK